MDVIQGQGKFKKKKMDVIDVIGCSCGYCRGYFYYLKNLLQVFWMLLGSNVPIFDENIMYYQIGTQTCVDINLDKIVVTHTLIFVSTANRIYKMYNFFFSEFP